MLVVLSLRYAQFCSASVGDALFQQCGRGVCVSASILEFLTVLDK